MSRAVRLLALLQSMRGRRNPVTALQLAQSLGVSERTIYRDLAELAAQGAPIKGEAGVGFILGPGLFLPPLMLNEEEVEAVRLGLALVDQRGDAVLKSAAETALAKIGSILSAEAQTVFTARVAAPGPNMPELPDSKVSVADLRAAVRGMMRLKIVYEDEQGAKTERCIWPILLGFMAEARVVVAWCELRDAYRFFRTDRMLSACAVGHYPARRSDLLRAFRAQVPSPSL